MGGARRGERQEGGPFIVGRLTSLAQRKIFEKGEGGGCRVGGVKRACGNDAKGDRGEQAGKGCVIAGLSV